MACWWPCPEGATNGHQLPQMVSVVVGNEQRFAEYGLPVTVRDWGKQVRRGIGHEVLHGYKIILGRNHAFVPRSLAWWGSAGRPEAFGKRR